MDLCHLHRMGFASLYAILRKLPPYGTDSVASRLTPADWRLSCAPLIPRSPVWKPVN